MKDIEIPLPPDMECAKVAHAIDDVIAEMGLTVTLRDSLRKFPGCTHWHVKNGRDPGTLEITLWPQEHRAWFSIQSGRTAPWIDERVKWIAQLLEERFSPTTPFSRVSRQV